MHNKYQTIQTLNYRYIDTTQKKKKTKNMLTINFHYEILIKII